MDSATITVKSKSIIEDLLEKPFSKRKFREKLLIIQNGRPCPVLKNLKVAHKDRKREYTRKFNVNQFSLYPWMTGCENKIKLYCWPCLLFSKTTNIWNSGGVKNLNQLTTLQRTHKVSAPHLESVFQLARFGEKVIDEISSSQQHNFNNQHNIKVKKNREVLKRLIDVTCYLANQELSFRCEEGKSVCSLNQGNYIEFLDLLKEYDHILSHYLETAPGFNVTSIEIQYDLIRAVGELLDSHIAQKLQQSQFVAIMLDEVPDIQMKSQLSVVLRYYFNTKIHESFVGFVDVSSGRTADDLFQLITPLLEKYDLQNKLVAQSYDGASIMSGQSNELQMKVKNICPKALFVHSYTHDLNLVLSQGLSSIRECRIFFRTLNGIAKFPSHSNKTSCTLQEFLKIPSLDASKWCISSQFINVILSYGENIQQYFESIQCYDSDNYETNDVMAAFGYCEFLRDIENVFLLNVFSKLFSQTDILFDALHIDKIDIDFCTNQVNKLLEFLKDQRDEGFQEIWQSAFQTVIPDSKKIKFENDEFDSTEEVFKNLFYEIIDNLSMQISERFLSIEKLKYFELLNWTEFEKYRQKKDFPEELIKNLIGMYPDIFEFTQLKNEFIVFLENTDAYMQDANISSTATSNTTRALDVMQWMESKNITTSFEQVYKLLKLKCTIPLSEERSFSAQKRIKRNLRNTQGQERLSYLTLMSIEREFLKELKESDSFYDRVIEKFLTFEQRDEFMLQ